MSAILKKLLDNITRHHQPVRVVREPLQQHIKEGILLLVFTLALFASFFAGRYWTSSVAYQIDELSAEKQSLENKLAQKEVELSAAKLEHQSIQEAVKEVRETNLTLQQQISDLEEEVTYYQRVMDPISNDKGLRIDSVEIENSSDPRRFRINVVLTQLGRQNRTAILGNLDIQFEGSLRGNKTIYSLEDLKVPGQDVSMRFRFRYYQEISEEFILPESFVVENLQITARASGSKAMEIQREQSWPFE